MTTNDKILAKRGNIRSIKKKESAKKHPRFYRSR